MKNNKNTTYIEITDICQAIPKRFHKPNNKEIITNLIYKNKKSKFLLFTLKLNK